MADSNNNMYNDNMGNLNSTDYYYYDQHPSQESPVDDELAAISKVLCQPQSNRIVIGTVLLG